MKRLLILVSFPMLAVLAWAGMKITSSDGTITFGTNIVAVQAYNVKSSFSTNYTITAGSGQTFHMLNGTNQLITLPTAASSPGVIYRFSMTNGHGSFVITNSGDSAKIRDGVSLSYTNIGINTASFISDGANWWLAAKGKTVFPCASWSLTNDVTPVQDTLVAIPFTTLEFNNSQGCALVNSTNLWATNAGSYMIQFSAMLKGTATPNALLSVWLRQDGSDVIRSRTDMTLDGASDNRVMTVVYFVVVPALGSYFNLVAASHAANPPTINTNPENPTGYTAPMAPAVIITINRVSDSWP